VSERFALPTEYEPARKLLLRLLADAEDQVYWMERVIELARLLDPSAFHEQKDEGEGCP